MQQADITSSAMQGIMNMEVPCVYIHEQAHALLMHTWYLKCSLHYGLETA